MLKWNETDVLTCLEAAPETDIEGQGLFYIYTVIKHGLTLKLAVWPLDGDIIIDLFQQDIHDAIFVMKIVDSPEIKYFNEKGKEWLEIAAGNCNDNRHESNQKKAYGIRLRIKPSIQIESFQADFNRAE